MVTTIQIQDTTLDLLKQAKSKQETYDDLIVKLLATRPKLPSMAGYLSKYGKGVNVVAELKKMRAKDDRY
jgi:predicted CopG family antitoxin